MKSTKRKIKGSSFIIPGKGIYEQILLALIHSHPVKSGYLKEITEYVMFREKEVR